MELTVMKKNNFSCTQQIRKDLCMKELTKGSSVKSLEI